LSLKPIVLKEILSLLGEFFSVANLLFMDYRRISNFQALQENPFYSNSFE